ncbi:kinase domain-containing protein [Saguinus oedipus]|uniref:Kinase domain-containing protein n=1 Tax=Saguinus oedipus TaxID=9490 RepID=A0ABQ9UJV6_SAGOE|nr:kinase domain-containing protein [Saguinus oedipus]
MGRECPEPCPGIHFEAGWDSHATGPLILGLQREAGGCALNFGPRGSSMVTIPRERLTAGMEYTFSLTVWKAGRKEEATNQTLGAGHLNTRLGVLHPVDELRPLRLGGAKPDDCQEGLSSPAAASPPGILEFGSSSIHVSPKSSSMLGRRGLEVLIRSGRVPIVSLECVSCKAQAVYEVSRSSYVYLEGRCLNCSSGSKQGRWAARTFSNKTLVLDETTTSTGSAGMQLVLRRGVLRDGEGYTFTLTVLGHSGEEEGCASIRLSPNRPPLGGSCRLFPLGAVHALTTKVYFECSGWQDAEDASAPLVYALLLRRCRQGHCEEFCVYKGSLSSYGAVLPPGFRPHFEVGLAVVVQDQLGAAVVALNRSVAIVLPEPNSSAVGLTAWLHGLTASVLPGLLRQADPQHVIEYSLALVTVLNEASAGGEGTARLLHACWGTETHAFWNLAEGSPRVPQANRSDLKAGPFAPSSHTCQALPGACFPYEQAPDMAAEPEHERQRRAQIRKNITETLVSLRVHTVDDIQQIAAALAQCMVGRPHMPAWAVGPITAVDRQLGQGAEPPSLGSFPRWPSSASDLPWQP